jgi:CRP-like cAMP-binding protein
MRELAFIYDEKEVPDSLKGVPFLQSFAKQDMEDILNSSSIVECEAGEVVIQEDKEAHRIFILLAGSLDVTRHGEPLTTVSETGEVFGELAALDHERRSSTVTAREKSFCLAIDQKFLEATHPREKHPSFYAALYGCVAKVLADRLKRVSDELARVEKELHELKQSPAGA